MGDKLLLYNYVKTSIKYRGFDKHFYRYVGTHFYNYYVPMCFYTEVTGQCCIPNRGIFLYFRYYMAAHQWDVYVWK